jgi:decaprenyl-phosphate phosphoribosyltransferase
MMLDKVKEFLKLMKWRFYFTTILIFIGYILVVWPNIGIGDIYMMLLLFLIFGPLLYGGIYSLNDIFDLKEDRKHSVKKKRPLAAGHIKVHEAYIFSISLIVLAVSISFAIKPLLGFICLLFLCINLLYSYKLKKIPYLEIITNTLTHPLRFYTGVIAAGAFTFHKLALLFGLFALAIAILKRKKELMEKQQKSREVLRYYTNISLRNFIILVGVILFIIIILSKNLEFYIGLTLLFFYALIMVGYHRTKFINKILNKWY